MACFFFFPERINLDTLFPIHSFLIFLIFLGYSLECALRQICSWILLKPPLFGLFLSPYPTDPSSPLSSLTSSPSAWDPIMSPTALTPVPNSGMLRVASLGTSLVIQWLRLCAQNAQVRSNHHNTPLVPFAVKWSYISQLTPSECMTSSLHWLSHHLQASWSGLSPSLHKGWILSPPCFPKFTTASLAPSCSRGALLTPQTK